MSGADPLVPRDELQAAIDARRELGPEHEPELVDAFVARVERQLAERLREDALPARRDERERDQRRLALALVSLGIAIPLTGIASGEGLLALVVVWSGIVLVNAVYARPGR